MHGHNFGSDIVVNVRQCMHNFHGPRFVKQVISRCAAWDHFHSFSMLGIPKGQCLLERFFSACILEQLFICSICTEHWSLILRSSSPLSLGHSFMFLFILLHIRCCGYLTCCQHVLLYAFSATFYSCVTIIL